jgi:hypothetical protein
MFGSRFFVQFVFIAGIFLGDISANSQSPGILPDSSEPRAGAATAIAESQTVSSFTSTLSGTVLDTNGDVIQGAHVQLSQASAEGMERENKSGATGQFVFTDIEPGTYIVTVTGEGMAKFVSKPIAVGAGESVIAPNVVLGIDAASTSVIVMDKEGTSIEQLKIAEQQRVLKVFPNFYSSYDWNAPPMLAKQKYQLAARTLIDPVTFLTTAGIAGAEQYKNVFPSFGRGIEGYGKRYGAAFASHASGELLTRAVFPSMFHTDPRYFIMGKGSTMSRATHALTSTWLTRGDDGQRRINWAEIIGSISAATLSNTYFPAQERGVNLVLINGLGNLGGDMVDNLVREFLLSHITTRGKH